MQKLLGLNSKNRARLALLLRQTRGTLSTRQAAEILQIPSQEASRLLFRFASQGWLSRVRRDLYVPVPLEAKTSEPALEDPWIIANQLFSPCYIGGWSAAEYWGLTEQIFRTILIITTKRPRQREPVLRGSAFMLRTIARDAFFGTQAVWRRSVKIEISDPTRTIIDLMNDPQLGGGLRTTADIFASYLKSEQKKPDLLITYGERLGNRAVFKRMGFLLEKLAPTEVELIAGCRQRLSQGNSKLDPALPAERLVTAWKLWVPKTWKERPRLD